MTRSLETKDTVKATARAGQAIRELQEEAERQGQSKWAADTPGTEWDIPTKPDGSNDYENATSRAIVAADVLEPEHLKQLDWRDLVKEAVRVRQRKTGDQPCPLHAAAGNT